MGINSNIKIKYLLGLVVLIIGLSLPIIDLDRDIHFSCITMNEENSTIVKGFVEPSEARFVRGGNEIRLYSRGEFLPQNGYTAKIYKVNKAISYYNGIAYRPVFGNFSEKTLQKNRVIFDGVLKIRKMSIIRLAQITVLNWLDPYSGEKIKL